MDKKQRIFLVGLVLCMLIVFAFASQVINTEEKEEGNIAKPITNTEEKEGSEETGGSSSTAGEKVREAVTTSFKKIKDAVEDSAKSAANIAGQTTEQTPDKVKRTFSTNSQAHDSDL